MNEETKLTEIEKLLGEYGDASFWCGEYDEDSREDYWALRSKEISASLAIKAFVSRLERELAAVRKDAERYRWLRSNCQYGFEDQDGPQLIHRNGETGPHQNARWREHLDAAIDAKSPDAKEKE